MYINFVNGRYARYQLAGRTYTAAGGAQICGRFYIGKPKFTSKTFY